MEEALLVFGSLDEKFFLEKFDCHKGSTKSLLL